MFGVAASIPLVILGARMIMTLLTRFPILVWAGGALLGWVAGQVIATDPIIWNLLTENFGEHVAKIVVYSSAALGAVIVVTAGWKIRCSALDRPA